MLLPPGSMCAAGTGFCTWRFTASDSRQDYKQHRKNLCAKSRLESKLSELSPLHPSNNLQPEKKIPGFLSSGLEIWLHVYINQRYCN